MVFLFLDLEITGFDLTLDQILELGAAVCELNQNQLKIIDTFTTLIKPTIDIPDHIPRLTGLDAADFIDAPHLSTAQKLWQTWIDSNGLYEKEVVVIGHSVATDIAFLKTNHFWLPSQTQTENKSIKPSKIENVPFCDTLDLAKILLPDQSNLNLEYLVKNLNLDENILSDASTFNSDLNLKNLKPHRALFDTLTGIEFFNFCLKRINKLNLPQSILDFLNSVNILPTKILSLGTVPASFDTNFKPLGNTDSKIINFKGKVAQPTLNFKIESCFSKAYEIIQHIESPKTPTKLKLVLNQIYIYLATKQQLPDFELRLHTYGLEERAGLEAITDFLLNSSQTTTQESNKANKDDNPQSEITNILPVFERVLSSIDELVEIEFEFAKFSYEIDFFAESYELEFNQAFTPKVSVEMDFLAARMEILLQQNPKKELLVNRPGQNNDLDLNDIFNLFQNICEKFNDLNLKLNSIPKSSTLIEFLALRIQNNITNFISQNWVKNPFIIRLSKNNLKLSKTKLDFSWDKYWESLSSISNIKLTTYLDQNGWKMLGDLISMPDELYEIPNEFVDCLRTSEIESTQNDQNTETLLKQTKTEIIEGSVCLILCGQNSGLDKVIEIAVSNFKPGEFLAMGESGSLAKISGKIRMGFSGMVIVKSTDLFIIKQIQNLKLNPTAILIQPPYLNLNQFWFEKTRDPKEIINLTKRILRNSITGQLSELGVKTIKYQSEIIR